VWGEDTIVSESGRSVEKKTPGGDRAKDFMGRFTRYAYEVKRIWESTSYVAQRTIFPLEGKTQHYLSGAPKTLGKLSNWRAEVSQEVNKTLSMEYSSAELCSREGLAGRTSQTRIVGNVWGVSGGIMTGSLKKKGAKKQKE